MAKTFINSIHAFRGFAIINIVAIHAVEFIFFFANTSDSPDKANLTPYAWANSILFHDSTLYFTFISGILFSMILVERGYTRFFKSKFSYVIFPYLFFTCLITWRSWDSSGALTVFDGSIVEYVTLVGVNFISGGAIFTFWYIPVLLVLYALTPLLAKLITMGKAKWLVVVLILAPLVCSRAWPEVTWTNFVYFIGAYLLGMVAGCNYERTVHLIKRYLLWVVLVAIASTLLLVGLFYMQSPTWGIIVFTESAWYVQKIAIAGLVLLLFESTMTTVPKWLDLLGNYAFSIYFLHGYLLFEMYFLMASFIGVPISTPTIIALAISNLVLVLLFSIIITYICKLVLGKWSRYFVGS
jgi:membrane-bound acyltransferase YfiQ involved in biofilm formation